MTTYAFIDSQNLKKSVEAIRSDIDYRRFRLWLKNKKGVDRAFMYFGFMRSHQRLYDYLERCGFELVFRDVDFAQGRHKANIDICLTISVLDQIDDFDDAYLITSDGDFFDLTERLKAVDKLGGVISPQSAKRCSRLLKKSCQGKISFIPELIQKFEKV
ncbi:MULTISPECIES: NYN domain-containing protein [Halocynthiibacter]|uniref:NYN domain-containing protein n=1 Tax=Halocynthiibacter halioticoli TaxID=2986804 RepID=A0AAE3LTH7_9RHOB|nr:MULTISPECIES: NYN domain-containing protein [Halocynthiibacter]MCV6825146.1 NYN domain-containing protein [Halocynthiibacter halioticoli]MCW4058147.1 NYN domain-containing protein [Halocynthiibacter sp. SDUM655004]